MSRHVVLDLRDAQPPLPVDRVLSTITGFETGDTLKVLADFEPFPIYRIVERDGFANHAGTGVHAPCEVTIWVRGT